MKTFDSKTRGACRATRAAAVAAVLVLAACGSDDPAPTGPVDPGPGPGAMTGDLPDAAIASSAALIAYLKDWPKSETGNPVELTTSLLPIDDTGAAIDI